MATAQTISRLGQIIKQLDGVDKDKLLRSNLGIESLKEELQSRLIQIDQIKNMAMKYSLAVSEETVNQAVGVFTQIFNQLNAQAALTNPQYISNRQPFLQQIDQGLEALKKVRPFFVVAALEEKGLLDSQDIQELNKQGIEQLKAGTKEALDHLTQEANHVLENARNLAKEIEDGARRTATGVSVQEAQKQFREVQIDINRQVVLWAVMSVAGLAFFLRAIYYFAQHQNLPDQWTWQILYYTAIRITFLSVIAAAAGYCFSLLKTYIQLRQRNKHRQCIANSIESFVNSALTKDQRDVIFANLVQSVISYGDSGFEAGNSESIFSGKIPIDAMTKVTSATVAVKK